MTSTSVDVPIGTATMESDGTIKIRLRVGGGGSPLGPPTPYPPTHERYTFMKDHVERRDGPMKPGENRVVYPFPVSD